MNLTKNSETVLFALYKIYKQRIKAGMPIERAIKFDSSTYQISSDLWQKLEIDFDYAINNLKSMKLVTKDILGSVKLTEDAIFLCENRKWDMAKETVEWITKLI